MDEEKIVSEGNKLKKEKGLELAQFIRAELELVKKEGVILGFQEKVNVAHPDFPYKSQYLANFVIETLSGKFIVVRSSNSYKGDRIKIGYYDFEGIVAHSSFSENIIATIYLFPDAELKKTGLISLRKKIADKFQYSSASHILGFTEFLAFLESHKYEVQNEDDDVLEEQDALSKMTLKEQGSFYGKLGNSYEKGLLTNLTSYKNLIGLKRDELPVDSIYRLIVTSILDNNDLEVEDVVRISASNTIPLLLSGGNPKTDVLITIEMSDRSTILETISIKKTTKNRVSCHDYSGVDFIRVLDCENTRLAEYFMFFQNEPTLSVFEDSLPNGYSVDEFTALLSEKKDAFNNWVLRGMHDARNLTNPKIQVSNYLLINKEDEVSFYLMTDYIKLITEKSKLTYGVPFSWTYPSKQRGKRIQLKVPVIM